MSILQPLRYVTLSEDIMKVNGIPFFMTVSKHIKFGSAGKLDSMENALSSSTSSLSSEYMPPDPSR
jgi:hypothetical protein